MQIVLSVRLLRDRKTIHNLLIKSKLFQWFPFFAQAYIQYLRNQKNRFKPARNLLKRYHRH